MRKKAKPFIGINYILICILFLSILSCGSNKKVSDDGNDMDSSEIVGPTFNSDSAFMFCQKQCEFGPRTMNSKAHDLCQKWIEDKFKEYGLEVITQDATLTGWDGTPLKACNIMASYQPENEKRVLLCAHWDSRPWADNDLDSENWYKPIDAANDGASGVAIMLEIARLLKTDSLNLNIGVDFVCFDAEDWGVPIWSDVPSSGDYWALGAQYWAENLPKKDYKPIFGILLDMVGGQGAQFFKESYSVYYASKIVEKVWKAARKIGFGSYFPDEEGGMITDDHLPVNEKTGIPTIDIIPYYIDCMESNFGPTWHTISDDMDHIDKNTLQAVGQTIIEVLFEE